MAEAVVAMDLLLVEGHVPSTLMTSAMSVERGDTMPETAVHTLGEVEGKVNLFINV